MHATTADEAAITGLLAAAGLPTEDWSEALIRTSVLAREGGQIIGVGAIEPRGDVGLLRSIAVNEQARGRGIAGRIVNELETEARRTGLKALYLLTTTARDFFLHRGYASLPRDQAPPEIRSTRQFGALCPASSFLMVKPMTSKIHNVLILCTGNSARSILGEALLNQIGARTGRFRGYSAGSQPKEQPNPFALELLERKGLPTAGLRSKSWDEFARADAPKLDFIFTVCDSAAGETCPLWPGHPVTAHWGLPDPAAVEGSDQDKRRAFEDAFAILQRRIERFASLPLESLEPGALKQELKDIGGL